MERFEQFDFPVSHLMTGELIPGVRQMMPQTKRSTFSDGSFKPELLKQELDPVKYKIPKDILATLMQGKAETPQQDFYSKLMSELNKGTYSKMHGDNVPGHGFVERLKELLGHKKKGAEVPEGFEPVTENRDWRTS